MPLPPPKYGSPGFPGRATTSSGREVQVGGKTGDTRLGLG